MIIWSRWQQTPIGSRCTDFDDLCFLHTLSVATGREDISSSWSICIQPTGDAFQLKADLLAIHHPHLRMNLVFRRRGHAIAL